MPITNRSLFNTVGGSGSTQTSILVVVVGYYMN